jgi:hypothetical protein
MNWYVIRGVVALLVSALIVVPGLYFRLPIVSVFPLETVILVHATIFFWRPVYVANGMKLGEAMHKAPSIAFATLVGPVILTLGALLSILIRSVN